MKTLLLTLCAVIGISYAQRIGLQIGDKAPEIIGKSPEGKEYKLSDLKGKVVLIDFWAGWCAPCRMENPNLVKAYQKYKNDLQFTIFGVSLDNKASLWKSAIKADGLIWPYHVSDLKGWSSTLSAPYLIRSIPANFLINKDGIIIARDLRGPSLHKMLESIK